MSHNLYPQIQEDMKSAMRTRDSVRLGTIRLLVSAIRQREIDNRITLDDAQILTIIEKMIKQRNYSIEQYQKGNRNDLADKEETEIVILKKYLPQPLTDSEVELLIKEALAVTGLTSVKDMSKVMAYIKNRAQGSADIAKISIAVRAVLK